MLPKVALSVAFALYAPSAFAVQYQSGDWSAVKIGNTCYVFTQRAAPDTSGTLIFGFGKGGYNAGFQYEYTPWYGETEAPWDDADSVVLEIDGAALWLSEEMFTRHWGGNYVADMTGGFVSEMVLNVISAQTSITVAFERPAYGETWVYGVFTPVGFRESLAQAAEWCEFEPRN